VVVLARATAHEREWGAGFREGPAPFSFASERGYHSIRDIPLTPEEIGMSPDFDPAYVFSHHAPTPDKLVHFDAIHAAALSFAEAILAHTPRCSDQAAALRLLRESAMMANAAIALGGRLTK
jgi:hypothetical protein